MATYPIVLRTNPTADITLYEQTTIADSSAVNIILFPDALTLPTQTVALVLRAGEAVTTDIVCYAQDTSVPSTNVTIVLYNMSGESTGLRALSLTADQGVYSVTGNSAVLTYAGIVARILNPDLGTYNLTGFAAQILRQFRLLPTVGGYSISGQSAGLSKAGKLFTTLGSYTITPLSATLKKQGQLYTTAGAYTVSGQSAQLSKANKLFSTLGTYTITGATATLQKTRILTISAGSYAVNGNSSQLTVFKRLNPDLGNYTTSGLDPILTIIIPIQDVSAVLFGIQNGDLSIPLDKLAEDNEQLAASLDSLAELMADQGSTSVDLHIRDDSQGSTLTISLGA